MERNLAKLEKKKKNELKAALDQIRGIRIKSQIIWRKLAEETCRGTAVSILER